MILEHIPLRILSLWSGPYGPGETGPGPEVETQITQKQGRLVIKVSNTFCLSPMQLSIVMCEFDLLVYTPLL